MPLVGGGGSPNVAGSGGTAGIGTGLNYLRVGERTFVTAQSGEINTAGSNNYNTMLNFSTGPEIIQAQLTTFGGYTNGSAGDGIATLTRITINGNIIGQINLESSTEDMPTVGVIPIIIAPYSNVLVEISATNSGFQSAVMIDGEVYA
mgnify:FL=1